MTAYMLLQFPLGLTALSESRMRCGVWSRCLALIVTALCGWWISAAPPGLLASDDLLTPAAIDVTPLDAAPQPSQIEQRLVEKLRHNPGDSAAWRLLGRARLQRRDWQGALEALQRAVELDDRSAAAYLDYSKVLQHFEQRDFAGAALRRVQELAPGTPYAAEAQSALDELTSGGEIQLASYDIRSFDGSNLLPQVVGPDPRDTFWQSLQEDFRVRIEVGSQYNTNVTLAPSNRELQNANVDSAQGQASLLIQWYAVNRNGFRLGPSLDSDFTLNEGGLDQYNLQSWRPGLFADGIWQTSWGELRPRVAYTFTHDEFGGETFGNRHALAASLASVWTPGQVSTLYYAIDRNNVANDGAVPSITSQDGWSTSIGLLHDCLWRDAVWRLLRIGGDYTYTDTTGSNYRFQGVSLYTQSNIYLRPTLQLMLRGGWAYRDYFDFTQTPSRNTNVLRAAVELRRFFAHGFSAALFAGYDRFLSDNDRYDTDRYQSGGVLTWEF